MLRGSLMPVLGGGSWHPEQILKTIVVAVMLAGVIPLLLGLLFELVIVAPLRVPLDQTPLFYPWQVKSCTRFHSTIVKTIGHVYVLIRSDQTVLSPTFVVSAHHSLFFFLFVFRTRRRNEQSQSCSSLVLK